MTADNADSRLELVDVSARDPEESIAPCVQRGLTARPKHLPSHLFYDREGSLLFERICDLPEYYLTRAERSILAGCSNELALRFSQPVTLVELGSGSASKTRLLIDAFLARHARLTFVPIDVSRSMLEQTAHALLEDYPSLEVLAISGLYQDGLDRLPDAVESPRLVLWLGSSIGNLDRPAAMTFLERVRERLVPGDRVLLGVDLRKDAQILERAYDDAQGVTAAFNLNLLTRLNRELGSEFELDTFAHRARFVEDIGRVEMHLVSRCEQRVTIGDLGLEIDFAQGETIHTENSYKYSLDEIADLARNARLRLEQTWIDDGKRFSLNLLAPA